MRPVLNRSMTTPGLELLHIALGGQQGSLVRRQTSMAVVIMVYEGSLRKISNARVTESARPGGRDETPTAARESAAC